MRRWRMVSTDRSGAQTKYPAALQCYKFDTSLLAAEYLRYAFFCNVKRRILRFRQRNMHL